jgi:hypothetical protein
MGHDDERISAIAVIGFADLIGRRHSGRRECQLLDFKNANYRPEAAGHGVLNGRPLM